MTDVPAPPTPQPPAPPASGPVPPAEPPSDPPATPDDQRVPYSRFSEVNDKLKATTTELEELRKWKDEQEQAKLSEIEKAQKAADEATARATAAEQRALELERSGWVTAAARAAGFADPADAALAVDLAAVADEQAAQKAVEKLANDKPHWLAQGKPAGFGTIQGAPPAQVPVGPDGKPDEKAAIGAELFRNLMKGGR